MFVQDKTVYKGTARYDGQPVSGEAFVALTYDNSDVTTTMAFAPDYANTSANSLVVTSAAGTTSGTTVLTVAGAVNSANKLMAFVGAPAAVSRGDVPDGKWETIVSPPSRVSVSERSARVKAASPSLSWTTQAALSPWATAPPSRPSLKHITHHPAGAARAAPAFEE